MRTHNAYIYFVPHSFSHFRFNMPPLDDALVYCHWRTKQRPPTHHDEHLNGENDALRWHCALRSRPETRRVKRRRYICLFRISWSNLYLNKQAKCITNVRTSEFVECRLCCGGRRRRCCRARHSCRMIVNCDGKRGNEQINIYVPAARARVRPDCAEVVANKNRSTIATHQNNIHNNIGQMPERGSEPKDRIREKSANFSIHKH